MAQSDTALTRACWRVVWNAFRIAENEPASIDDPASETLLEDHHTAVHGSSCLSP